MKRENPNFTDLYQFIFYVRKILRVQLELSFSATMMEELLKLNDAIAGKKRLNFASVCGNQCRNMPPKYSQAKGGVILEVQVEYRQQPLVCATCPQLAVTTGNRHIGKAEA